MLSSRRAKTAQAYAGQGTGLKCAGASVRVAPPFRPGGRLPRFVPAALLAGTLLACGAPEIDRTGPTADWPVFGGDPGGLRYSPLTQINAHNVERLELVWEHH